LKSRRSPIQIWCPTWCLLALGCAACNAPDAPERDLSPKMLNASFTTPTSDTGTSAPTLTTDSNSLTTPGSTQDTATTEKEDLCVFEACGGSLDGLWVGTYECGMGVVDYDYGTVTSSTVGPYGDYFDGKKRCAGVALDRTVDIEVWYLFEEDTLYTSFSYDVDTVSNYPKGCGDSDCADIVEWYTQFYEVICDQPQNDPCLFTAVCEPGPEGCGCSFELAYTWNSGVQPYTTDGVFLDVDGLHYTYCVDGETTLFGDPETSEGTYVIERP
jgi:hypothetical protein